MRPGPESPSCQRSLQRGDAYQPAVTPSASLGTPASGSPLPVASPGARGIELDSSLGALASPSLGPGLPVTCWGWAGADEGGRRKQCTHGGGRGQEPHPAGPETPLRTST